MSAVSTELPVPGVLISSGLKRTEDRSPSESIYDTYENNIVNPIIVLEEQCNLSIEGRKSEESHVNSISCNMHHSTIKENSLFT